MAERHVDLGMARQRLRLPLELVLVPEVVGAAQRDVVGGRLLERAVERRGQTAVGVREQRDAIQERLHGARGPVGGAVVDHDHLVRRSRLREHRLERLRDPLLLVVGRDRDADRGSVHPVLLRVHGQSAAASETATGSGRAGRRGTTRRASPRRSRHAAGEPIRRAAALATAPAAPATTSVTGEGAPRPRASTRPARSPRRARSPPRPPVPHRATCRATVGGSGPGRATRSPRRSPGPAPRRLRRTLR